MAWTPGRPGRQLDAATRTEMERHFGSSLADVRIHTDADADRSARALSARAYSSGRDIAFAAGSYAPSTFAGRRLLAHELTHAQQRATNASVESPTGSAEREADRVSARVALGLRAGPISASVASLARTPTSDHIEPLISYSLFDLTVSEAEEAAVIRLLAADPDLSATIADLDSAGMLDALILRVDETTHRRALLQLLGRNLNSSARALVEPHIASLGAQWQLQYNLARAGVTAGAAPFNPAPLASLVSSNATAPFTGAGATGVNPTTLGIPWTDQARLAAKNAATTARYSNPIPGSLPAYLGTLTTAERKQQAELLLRRPISSVDSASFAGSLPSRAQVIRAAARAHALEPALVAAFILAEQRDQSQNEDAKDYTAATSRVMQANTSIGLGQVVVSTAQRHDLFADLLSAGTRAQLSHNEVARLLASDEHNIFAVARYIRIVANKGAKIAKSSLPSTVAAFPGIDMAAYARHSSSWPDDNVRALASEYTSRAWDDSVVPAWGDFVFEAFRDVTASGAI